MDNKGLNGMVLKGMLNPISMRIVQVLLVNETATAKIISENMPDIPAASLYRYINKLVKENILEVIAENKIRGTIEKVYKLKTNPFKQVEEYAEKGGREEHFNVFYTFAMSLLSDFQNYLGTEGYDMQRDNVGFRSYPIYASDEEVTEFLKDLKAAFEKLKDNEPGGNRTLRKFSIVIMPGKEK